MVRYAMEYKGSVKFIWEGMSFHDVSNAALMLTYQLNLCSGTAHLSDLLSGPGSPANLSPRFEDVGEDQSGYGNADGRTGDCILPANVKTILQIA